MDISRAYQEVKSLPDEALTKELEQPSGMMPGYLVMAELEDRKALRSSTSQPGAKTSMKDELLQGIGSVGYSSGGLVAQANPFYSQMQAQMNPQYAAQMMQDQMTSQNNGYFPLNPPNTPGQPQAPGGLSSLVPSAPSAAPRPYAKGGAVEEPKQKYQTFAAPGDLIKVGSEQRVMPMMSSDLMQRDMQGWQLAHGMLDYKLVNPMPLPGKDDGPAADVTGGMPSDGETKPTVGGVPGDGTSSIQEALMRLQGNNRMTYGGIAGLGRR